MLGDDQKRPLKRRISRELFGARKKPGIDFRVDGAQFGLQARRVAFRVVHKKARIDAEEPRQQLACRYAWLRPRPISLFIAVASSCCVIERPKPRSEPSTARRERSLSPSFMGTPTIAMCKMYIAIRNLSSRIGVAFHFCILLNLNDLLILEMKKKAAN